MLSRSEMTSAKEGMFYLAFVCFSDSLSLSLSLSVLTAIFQVNLG